MTRGNKFVIGLAVGASAGVLAGLLLAPKSGKESREVIKARAGQIGSRTRQLMAGRKAST